MASQLDRTMPWSTSTRRQQLPANWSTIRRAVLERDGHRCRDMSNGDRCNRGATDVDHRGNPHDHRGANLQSLCPDHHKVKTAAEGHAAMRQRRQTARHPTEQHPGLT